MGAPQGFGDDNNLLENEFNQISMISIIIFVFFF